MKRYIETHFNCTLDIDVEGEAYLFGNEASKVDEACALVKDLVVDIRVGDTFVAEVSEVKDFGAMVRIARCQEALLHYSEISHDRALISRPVNEILKVGQEIQVKVLALDAATGQIKVSRKALLPESTVPDTNITYVSNFSKPEIPEFPVHPPRKWNREFFRKHVAVKDNRERAMQYTLSAKEPSSSTSTEKKPWSRRSESTESAKAPKSAENPGDNNVTSPAEEDIWDVSAVPSEDHAARLLDLDDFSVPTDIPWSDAVRDNDKGKKLGAYTSNGEEREAALCWKCGQEGHLASDCPISNKSHNSREKKSKRGEGKGNRGSSRSTKPTKKHSIGRRDENKADTRDSHESPEESGYDAPDVVVIEKEPSSLPTTAPLKDLQG